MQPTLPLDGVTPRIPRSVLWRVLARATTSSVALVGVYYLAPLDSTSAASAVAFGVGLVAVALLVAWQVRAVLAAEYPMLRSIEALAVTLPLYVVLWSVAFVLLSLADPAAFSEELDRTDGIYLTVSVLATVGFGDIVGTTEWARAAVTVQMVTNLVLVGLVLRVFVGAAQLGRSRRDLEAQARHEPVGPGAGSPGGAGPTGSSTPRVR